MTVVVITGILATVGIASLRGYVSAARGSEAFAMVQSIRGAEERWRAEHMMYLNVSSTDEWYPRDPREAETRNTQQSFFYAPDDETHADNARWLLLRPTVAGPVRFGYVVNAGPGGGTMTDPTLGPDPSWPAPAPDNWYVIQAIGDADGDGTISYYRSSSLGGQILTENHGE